MIELDKDFDVFVENHRGEDPLKLRLRYGRKDAAGSTLLALDHLACVSKAGRKFDLPDGTTWMPRLMLNPLSVEQASSAHVALMRASLVDRGLRILDMTCGLGMDIRGFLTREPVEITGIEMNRLSADVAAVNFKEFPNVKIIKGDSVEYLSSIDDDRYDLIYIDPARRDSSGGRVYNLHDCTPDLTAILPEMLRKSRIVMAKLSPMLDITQTLADLTGISRLIAVEEKGECKELLVVIERDFDGEAKISTGLEADAMSFTLSQEKNAGVHFGEPEAGLWLHVPGAGAMKAGCFKLLSASFDDMAKVAPNSHLYISHEKHDRFPGKAYYIDDVIEYTSSNIKRLAGERLNADVTVRNFPLTAAELQKKLKIRPGNGCRLFATVTSTGRKVLIISGKSMI